MSSPGYVRQKISRESSRHWSGTVAKYRARHGIPKPSTSTDRSAWIARYYNDPVLFAVEVLGLVVWSLQAELMRAFAVHGHTACRSGHKVSKSTTAAALALWWVCTRAQGRVVLTAPTARQVKDILWRELRALASRAKTELPTAALDPATGMRWDDGRYIVGLSTDKPEQLQGYSGAEIAFIVDEASGYPEELFEAIEGNLAGGGKILLLGNPTQPSGTFFDAWGEKAEQWFTLHISSEQSPNVTGECAVPGLATKDWVEERKRAWGENSPLYQVRVRGNFAAANTNGVVALGTVLAAIQRHDAAANDNDDSLTVGVDVARFGDDESVSCARRGKQVVEFQAVNGFDEEAVAGLVLNQVKRLRRRGERPTKIRIDVCGVGAGVASILRQSDMARERLIEIVGINAADAATDDEYPNLRSQLWFSGATWLEEGGAIPDDKKLQAELVAPTYSFDAQGRRVVEKKESFKKRLKRSPDRADALMLSIYRGSDASAGSYAHGSAGTRWGYAGRGYG